MCTCNIRNVIPSNWVDVIDELNVSFMLLGSSMTEFRKMVLDFVVSKLGTGDHSSLITNIMEIADVNKDSKVSVFYTSLASIFVQVIYIVKIFLDRIMNSFHERIVKTLLLLL